MDKNKNNEDLLSSANRKYKQMEKDKNGCRWHWSFTVVTVLIVYIVGYYFVLRGAE